MGAIAGNVRRYLAREQARQPEEGIACDALSGMPTS